MDFAQIAQLKSNAKIDEAGSVKEVAQQFESIFINMMLQSMRKARAVWLMDSDAAQTYEAMFDQELALHLSEQGGFGVARHWNAVQMNQSRTRVAAPMYSRSGPSDRSMHLSQGLIPIGWSVSP